MIKILVIDDSALMRKVAREHLEAEGFVVDELLPETVAELADRLAQAPPDLVLSDFNMPKVDGLNVARTVRRADPGIPVVILTANRDPGRDSLLQTMGVRKILHKPISGADLVKSLCAVLTRA